MRSVTDLNAYRQSAKLAKEFADGVRTGPFQIPGGGSYTMEYDGLIPVMHLETSSQVVEYGPPTYESIEAAQKAILENEDA